MTRSWEARQSPWEKTHMTGDTILKTTTATITARSEYQVHGTGTHIVRHGTGIHGPTARGDITTADGTTHGTTEAGMIHGITEVIGDGTIHGTAHIIITTDGTTLTGATTIIIRDTARAMSLEEVTKTHGMD